MKLLHSVVSLLLLFAVLGCSKSPNTLSGKVLMNGTPVVMGQLVVLGSDGIPRGAAIQPDGSYTVYELPLGPVQIAVDSPAPVEVPDSAGSNNDDFERPKKSENAAAWRKLPERYGNMQTSELSVQIQRGPNVFNVEMKD